MFSQTPVPHALSPPQLLMVPVNKRACRGWPSTHRALAAVTGPAQEVGAAAAAVMRVAGDARPEPKCLERLTKGGSQGCCPALQSTHLSSFVMAVNFHELEELRPHLAREQTQNKCWR